MFHRSGNFEFSDVSQIPGTFSSIREGAQYFLMNGQEECRPLPTDITACMWALKPSLLVLPDLPEPSVRTLLSANS